MRSIFGCLSALGTITMSSFISQNGHLKGYNCTLFIISKACVTESNNDSEEFAWKTEFYKMYQPT